VPATSWDIVTGILAGLQLIRLHKVNLIHARAHVPGMIALALKRLTGAKFLFDLRGFMAEEYADAGIWPANGLLYRATKRAERALVQAADGVVVLTEKAKALIREWYPHEINGKPVRVIPCCVDTKKFPKPVSSKAQQNAARGATTIVYVGKLGGWYPVEEMVAFGATAMQSIPDLHWQVWTQSDTNYLRQLISAQGLANRVTIGCLPPDKIVNELVSAQAGLCFYKRDLSKAACSPTKIGEYLAAGLPVISTAGIGDVDELLTGQGNGSNQHVGVLVTHSDRGAYRQAALEALNLMGDPTIRQRCRAVAEEQLDLRRIGWPRYRQVYQAILGDVAVSQ
jgi:glycosyltransferase involved in cell wall biosynthesis